MVKSAMKKGTGIAAVLTVAGCVTGAPSTQYHVVNPYVFFSHAASRGVIPVMAVGDPYPGRRAQVEAAIVAALDRNFRSFGNPFRAVPPAPGEGTKVVVVFNATPLAQGVCGDPSRNGGAPAGATTTAFAVYCGVGPYSEYWMSFPTPPSPDDPQFRAHMLQLTHYAIPREEDPARRNSTINPPL